MEKMLLAVKKKLSRSAAKEDLHQVLSSYFQHTFHQEGSEVKAAVDRVYRLCQERSDEACCLCAADQLCDVLISQYTSTWKMLHIELNLELDRLSVDKAGRRS